MKVKRTIVCFAAALGLDPSHVDRVRLAALMDDPTAARDEQDERRRMAERVAAGMIDEQAAGWLLARFDPVPEAPLEARYGVWCCWRGRSRRQRPRSLRRFAPAAATS